jgi:uncharacterized membrane protein
MPDDNKPVSLFGLGMMLVGVTGLVRLLEHEFFAGHSLWGFPVVILIFLSFLGFALFNKVRDEFLDKSLLFLTLGIAGIFNIVLAILIGT